MHPAPERQDITSRIKAVITPFIGEAPHDHSRLITDLGFDSLDMVELAMNLEEEFGVEIPDEEWDEDGDKSVEALTDIVMAKLAAKAVA